MARSALANSVTQMGRAPVWKTCASVPIPFSDANPHCSEGAARDGPYIMSSVERESGNINSYQYRPTYIRRSSQAVEPLPGEPC